LEKELKLNQNGLDNFSKANVILENIIMGLWITLGTIACWFFNPIIAWIYLSLAIMIIFVVLRKMVCTRCYYYDKWCHIGWGKLSAKFFKKRETAEFSTCKGLKLAPITYGLLMIIPLVLIIFSMVFEFTLYKLVITIFLVLVSFYSSVISRKKGCEKCKMNLVCPGSAIK